MQIHTRMHSSSLTQRSMTAQTSVSVTRDNHYTLNGYQYQKKTSNERRVMRKVYSSKYRI